LFKLMKKINYCSQTVWLSLFNNTVVFCRIRTAAIAATIAVMAANAGPTSAAAGSERTERVFSSGPHDRTVDTTETTTDLQGKTSTRRGRYIEVRNGMHYLDEDGAWQESVDRIEATPGGAAALRGPYKAIFSNVVNSEGTVDLLAVDGKRFLFSTVGIAWYDASSGKSAWIGTVRRREGRVLPPNQVIYEDAFEGIRADIRYTYTSGAFEADVILRQNPSLPPGFGADTARLRVITAFKNHPDGGKLAPVSITMPLKRELDPVRRAAMAQPDFEDSLLDFGAMQMVPGRAFSTQDAQDMRISELGSPVAKQWIRHDENTSLLFESVEYSAVRATLQGLPAQAGRPRAATAGALDLPKARSKHFAFGTYETGGRAAR
jgi:hypothetical protein